MSYDERLDRQRLAEFLLDECWRRYESRNRAARHEYHLHMAEVELDSTLHRLREKSSRRDRDGYTERKRDE